MTAPVTLSPAGVLRATAVYFEADPTRWGKEWYRDPATGCRCVGGGVAYVIDPGYPEGDPTFLPGDPNRRLAVAALDAFEAYLRDVVGFARPLVEDDDFVNPWLEPLFGYWNDRQPDAATVIGTLRAAADWAEARREVAS